MICSGGLGPTTVPMVHDMKKVSAIYVYCSNQSFHEQWAQQWPKIKGVFIDIILLCEALKKAVQGSDQNTISMSLIDTNDDPTNKNLDQFDQSFVYAQILKEILLKIDFEQHHINDFINYCRDQFSDNKRELKNIDTFEQEYIEHDPIWWYTYPCFLHSMLNRALQMMEFDIIITMGFFIQDLYKRIIQLHTEQFAGQTHSNLFIVYHGQGLTQTDFDQLVQTKGGLLSFNYFLSTNMDRQASLDFVRETIDTSDLIGILFKMKINPSIPSTSFANIRNASYIQGKEEILFAIHSIFRIRHIKRMDNNNDRLWQVNLTLISDNDPDLYVLTESIQKHTFPQKKGWYRLCNSLIKVGQFEKAQKICEMMLTLGTNDRDEASIYHMLGVIKNGQEYHEQSIKFYQKSIAIKQKILAPIHFDLAISYACQGSVYNKMGKHEKALSCHEKALEILEKISPSNPCHVASSYNDIGKVYDNMNDYSKALLYYEIALDIIKKNLPSNHPDLATSYNHIGMLCNKMGNYSEALSSHEKALEIFENIGPRNQPDVALSLNNIGAVYTNMHDYSKALSFYERALDMGQRSLPENHPNLQIYKKNVVTERKKS